jgi:hypothetical protein
MIVVSRGRPCHVPTVPLVTLYSSLDFPATIAMSYRARSHVRSGDLMGWIADYASIFPVISAADPPPFENGRLTARLC